MFDQLDRDARAVRAAGADSAAEPLDHLRCASFVDRLTAAAGSGHSPSRAPVQLQVVMSMSSLLGLDSEPAWLHGYGVITRSTVQQLVDAGDVTITRLFCDPYAGGVVATDPTRYTPSGGLRHAVVCRDRHCRMPVCTARIRQLDHIKARVDGGLTDRTNLHGLSELCHLAKHHPRWRVDGDADGVVTWRTPTGHTYRSHPPPAVAHGTGPPRSLDDDPTIPAWLSREQRLRRIDAA
jgi:hypothetical protein